MTDDNLNIHVHRVEAGTIELSAPDYHDELLAAGTAAVLAADYLRALYTDSDLAAMFDTAGRFVNDVVKYDMARDALNEGNPERPSPARGQAVDLFLLELACRWQASFERDRGMAEAAVFIAGVREMLTDAPSTTRGEHRYEAHREDRP